MSSTPAGLSGRLRNGKSVAPRTPSNDQPSAAQAEEHRGDHLPPFCDRRGASRLIEERYGIPYPARTLERSGIPVRHINGRAIMRTADVLAFIEAKIAAAPLIAGHPRARIDFQTDGEGRLQCSDCKGSSPTLPGDAVTTRRLSDIPEHE